MKSQKTDILILGGGIGGYEVYRSLAERLKCNRIQKKITLIDKHEYFAFIPLLHEVASGSINPTHTTINLCDLVQGTPHQFINTTVLSIDPEKKQVTTEKGTISYTYCIIALGSSVNYFGVEGAETNALPIRTYEHAVTLQKRLNETILSAQEKPVTINVIGGGFTGIEIAGQVHDIACTYRKKHKGSHTISIHIIEAGKTILAPLPPKVQQVISRVLTKENVVIYTGKAVARVNADSVILEDGTVIPSSLAIWSGGVKNIAEPLLPAGYTEKGRVLMTQYLTHPLNDALYAVGDVALAKNKKGQVIPQLGEAAHREGEYVADHIIARLQKKAVKPFDFTSKGTLIPVGSRFGAAVIGPFVLFGTLAWYLRRAVYLMFVPGWKNKLHIIIDWALRR